MIALEAEMLDELRRMNKLLTSITIGWKRYWLAFGSGVARGLGAALGATVIFTVFIAILSRLDTTPVIGSYVRGVIEFLQNNSTASQRILQHEQTPAATPAPVPSAVPSGR